MPTKTPYKIIINTGNVTWTNMPTALTELFGNVHRRLKTDLTDVDKIRLVARVSTVGSAAAILKAEYSLDESSWLTLTTNSVSLASIGTIASAWESIPVDARGDVFIRVIGQDNNGTADPVLGNIMLEAR